MNERKPNKRNEKPRVRAYGTGHFEYRERVSKAGRVTRFAFGYVFSKQPKENGERKHYATGATKREAEAAAKAKATEHDELWERKNKVAPLVMPTLCHALTEKHLHNGQPYTSFKKYRSVVAFVVDFNPLEGGKALGDYLVSEIELHHLEGMYRAWCLTHEGQSQPFMRDMLNGLFKRLIKRRLIVDNPAEDLPRAKRKKQKKRMTVNDSNLRPLFELADERMRAMLILSRRNLRIGEVLAVTESCIKGNTLTVTHQMNDIWNPNGDAQKSVWGMTYLKHRAEPRVFELSDLELEVLEAALRLAKPVKVYNQVSKKWEQHRFVVSNANGEDWHYNDFLLALKELTKKAGVTFRPHDGRRLFASGMMREETINPDAIRQSMGHSNLETTMLYMRSDLDDEAKVNAAASRQVLSAFGLTERS